MAGLLTRSKNSVFPSFDSDILPFPFAELTAAGTVQDSHLFPSQDFSDKNPSPPNGGKSIKNINSTTGIIKKNTLCQTTPFVCVFPKLLFLPPDMEITNLLEYSSRQQLREWFEQKAATERCCWVATHRSKQPPPGHCLPYIEVVEEALCFGWIDSTVKRLPDGRLAQRLSPRRKDSHWTELNRQRCADLERRGLMTEAGREVMRRLSRNDDYE